MQRNFRALKEFAVFIEQAEIKSLKLKEAEQNQKSFAKQNLQVKVL